MGEKLVEISVGTKIYYECERCTENFYLLWEPDLKKPVLECKPCFEHAKCYGGNVIGLDPGYWRFHNTSDEIIYCKNAP